MYKQGALGFATTKTISMRKIFRKNLKWFTVPQWLGRVNQYPGQGESPWIRYSELLIFIKSALIKQQVLSNQTNKVYRENQKHGVMIMRNSGSHIFSSFDGFVKGWRSSELLWAMIWNTEWAISPKRKNGSKDLLPLLGRAVYNK